MELGLQKLRQVLAKVWRKMTSARLYSIRALIINVLSVPVRRSKDPHGGSGRD